jgi:hypothetical protein
MSGPATGLRPRDRTRSLWRCVAPRLQPRLKRRASGVQRVWRPSEGRPHEFGGCIRVRCSRWLRSWRHQSSLAFCLSARLCAPVSPRKSSQPNPAVATTAAPTSSQITVAHPACTAPDLSDRARAVTSTASPVCQRSHRPWIDAPSPVASLPRRRLRSGSSGIRRSGSSGSFGSGSFSWLCVQQHRHQHMMSGARARTELAQET